MSLSACGDPDPVPDTDIPTDQNSIATTETDRLDRTNAVSDEQTQDRFESATYPLLNSSEMQIGTVFVQDTADGITLTVEATSIPEGAHAIHFHTVGRCDGPDFTSAEGHYNPSGVNHGFDASDPKPHAGDMRNFDAPASGVVTVSRDNPRVSLSDRGGFAPLRDSDDTALIIHAGPDDYTSQPSGDAGSRIACAVID